LAALPAARSRSRNARSGGLYRAADNAALYRALRTPARHPPTDRRPRRVPLSRATGASPTRAVTCLPGRVPSSGSSASSVRATAGPTPGAVARDVR
jgi:hypothetical protein